MGRPKCGRQLRGSGFRSLSLGSQTLDVARGHESWRSRSIRSLHNVRSGGHHLRIPPCVCCPQTRKPGGVLMVLLWIQYSSWVFFSAHVHFWRRTRSKRKRVENSSFKSFCYTRYFVLLFVRRLANILGVRLVSRMFRLSVPHEKWIEEDEQGKVVVE